MTKEATAPYDLKYLDLALLDLHEIKEFNRRFSAKYQKEITDKLAKTPEEKAAVERMLSVNKYPHQTPNKTAILLKEAHKAQLVGRCFSVSFVRRLILVIMPALYFTRSIPPPVKTDNQSKYCDYRLNHRYYKF